MKSRGGKPWVWVTWVTGLLAETDQCYWKAWAKAHYKYEKVPDSGDGSQLRKWIEEHDAMTASRVQRLKSEGYEVLVEDEGAFKLEGQQAILSGKPDIIALKPKDRYALIVDEKSGRVKDQYIWQVLLYIFATSLTRFKDGGWRVRGEIEYKNSVVPINELRPSERTKISHVMQVVGGPNEPARVPSKAECQYCDVLECPDRFVDATGDASKFF